MEDRKRNQHQQPECSRCGKETNENNKVTLHTHKANEYFLCDDCAAKLAYVLDLVLKEFIGEEAAKMHSVYGESGMTTH